MRKNSADVMREVEEKERRNLSEPEILEKREGNCGG